MEASDDEVQQDFIIASSVPTYWLTGFMVLRLLGIIYAVGPVLGTAELPPFEL